MSIDQADVHLCVPTPARQPRFSLGQTVATPGALRTLAEFDVEPLSILLRHVCGDWGDLCAEDLAQNELALQQGMRLMSSYLLTRQVNGKTEAEVIWVITEWDRSVTTFLQPCEY